MNIKLPKQKYVYNRRNLILKETAGHSVLHIGCTDSPYTKERLSKGKLLHQQLLKDSKRVVGIDIDKRGLEMMIKNGINDVYELKIENLSSSFLKDQEFDYIVLSEVLEHLPNAGEALEEIKKYIIGTNEDTKLIVTVPNINNYLRTFLNYLRNVEQIHPEHMCYYSYITLKNILEYSGFKIKKFRYATYGLRGPFKLFAILLNTFSSSFMPSLFSISKVFTKKVDGD